MPKVVNHQLDPTFSADGHYLGYSRTTTSPQSELVIRDRREQREVNFRPRDSRPTVRYPSFASNGSAVGSGLYDIDTDGWVPMRQTPVRADGPTTEDIAMADPTRPTLNMIFDKLGLKMESSKAPVELFVIDHVEKPTEN